MGQGGSDITVGEGENLPTPRPSQSPDPSRVILMHSQGLRTTDGGKYKLQRKKKEL